MIAGGEIDKLRLESQVCKCKGAASVDGGKI